MKLMKTKKHFLAPLMLILMCLILASCFGPRLNKKHIDSNAASKSLAIINDENINVRLDDLIVRNAEGSWAKDANWDEYIFSIGNTNNQNIIIQQITVIDGLGNEVFPENNRRKLNKATRRTKNRFNKAGIKIELGKGRTDILVGSITGVTIGAGVGAGIASSGSVAVSAGTLTTAGGAVVVAVPAVAIGGIIKIVNNSKINNKIQERKTPLPLILKDGENSVGLFYPATPSPSQINIEYLVNEQEFNIKLILSDNFKGLHYK